MTNHILTKLISFPTITSNLEVNSACLAWCKQTLSQKGIPSNLITVSGRPLLNWGSKPEEARIMINSHADVVPAPQSDFQAKISNGKVFGRGSADTKSAVSALLNLSPNIIKTAVLKNILFSLSSDEEIGGTSTKEFIAKLPVLKFGLFAEPTNLKIVTRAKGMMQIKITSVGKTAHGSRPWLGKNAIVDISRCLHNFLFLHPIPTSETTNTTFNFSLISGGSAVNQIPGSCQLTLDIRLNPSDSPSKIIKTLKKIFAGCQLDILKNESPISTNPTNPLVDTLKTCLESNGIRPEITFDHGSSDARHCTALKIPAVVFGPIGDNLHQDNEWVNLQSVAQFQQVLELFIQNC